MNNLNYQNYPLSKLMLDQNLVVYIC